MNVSAKKTQAETKRASEKSEKGKPLKRRVGKETRRWGAGAFQALIQNLSEMLLVFDDQGMVSFEAPSCAKTLGYPEGYFVGRSPFPLVHPEDLERVLKDFDDALHHREDQLPTVFRFKKADDTWALLEAVAENLMDHPDVCGIVITLRDITERRRAEERQQEVEEHYRMLFHATQDVIYTVLPDMTLESVSPSVETVLGYKPEEIVGTSLNDFLHLSAGSFDQAVSRFTKISSGTGIGPTEYRAIAKDGCEKILEVVSTRLMREGQFIGLTGIARDVTEKRRTEERLHINEERFRNILQNMDSGYFEVDLKGNLIFFNQALGDFLGYSEEELTGMNFRTFMDPAEAKKVFGIFSQVYLTQEPMKNFYWQFTRKDGTKTHSVASAYLFRDACGEVAGFRGTARDVTELKQMEEALRGQEETFRALTENSLDLIARFDRHYRMLYVNPIIGRVTGSVPQDWIGKSIDEFAYPAPLVDQWKSSIGRTFETGSVQRAEYLLPGNVWTDCLFVPEFNIDGEVKAVMVSARNITRHKRALETLKESESRLADIIDFLPDPTFVIDTAGTVITWNRAMEEMMGVKAADIVGKGDYAYALPFYGEKRPILADLVLRAEKEVEEKYLGVSRQGERLFGISHIPDLKGREAFLWGTAAPLRNSEGRIVGVIESIRDITQGKQVEKELHLAKEAADQANRAKSDFLANMSHEIRTPLNAIMGMAELGLDLDLPQEAMDIVHTVNREADHLLHLINDILDFAKIEAGRLELESIAFDLSYLMDNMAGAFAFQAGQKGLEFLSYLEPEVPTRLVGDPGRLRQILVNLVGNAFKFTREGEVCVTVALVADDDTQATLHFSIRDTGIGIPGDKQEKIFESFTQADGSTTRKYGGTGLGTTISKHLVELMGGRIGLQSEEGGGATFWFEVPLGKQRGQAMQSEPDRMTLRGRSCLIVDDHAVNRQILRGYLASWGCGVLEADGGEAALAVLAKEQAAGRGIDLLLTDHQMPDMDGFDLAEAVKGSDHWKNLPVILITSAGNVGDGKRCRDAGLQGYLTKPLRKNDLSRAIAKTLYTPAASGQTLVTRHSLAESTHRAIRILLVEDYPTSRQIALKHLTDAGYTVEMAEHGKQALEAWQSRPFDLILMDIQMPVMDGYEAAKRIRETEVLSAGGSPSPEGVMRRVPIVAMTAHAMKEFAVRCLEAGMDDVLTKPFRRRTLLEVVERWAGSGGGDMSSRPVMWPASAEGASPTTIFDWAKALAEFDGDREFLKGVVTEFVEAVKEQLAAIPQALASGDLESVCRNAHSIKGGAANLTAVELSEAARVLESLGRSGHPEGLQAGIEGLHRAFDRFVGEWKHAMNDE